VNLMIDSCIVIESQGVCKISAQLDIGKLV